MSEQKKYLDLEGVKVLWNQVNLNDYPNNETLIAVLNAIDQTKADKDELFSGSWNDLEDKPFGEELSIGFTGETRTITFTTDDKGWAEISEIYLIGSGDYIYKKDGVSYFGTAKAYQYDEDGEPPIEVINPGVYSGPNIVVFTDENGNQGGIIASVTSAGYLDWTEFHNFEPNSEVTIEIGQGGKVEIIKTIDPKYIDNTYIDEQISSHTHSWNDLKDKPFGKEIEEYVLSYPEVYTFDAFGNDGVYQTVFYCYELFDKNEEETVIVYVDGVKYVDTIANFGKNNVVNGIAPADGECPVGFVGSYEGNGIYLVTLYYYGDGNSHEVGLYNSIQIIKTIDPIFLPNEGKVSWYDLSDRPFGEITESDAYTVTFSNLIDTGKTNEHGETIYECSTSDSTWILKECLYDTDITVDIYDEYDDEYYPYYTTVVNQGDVYALGHATLSLSSIYWSCEAIYLGAGTWDYQNEKFLTTLRPINGEITLTFNTRKTENKKLSYEYLPFGTNTKTIDGYEIIFPVQDVELTRQDINGYDGLLLNNLVEGTDAQTYYTYSIYLDGTIYTCSPVGASQSGFYLGNQMYRMNNDYYKSYDTKEPFYFQVYSGNWNVRIFENIEQTTHTIGIAKKHVQTIEETTPILEDCIPDSIARTEYVNEQLTTKADSDHNHDSDYDTKGAADAALTSAKSYADTAALTAANAVKEDLLNGAGEAYDTLKELGELIDENHDAIDALETVATGKADKEHTHSWNDLNDKPFGESESKLYWDVNIDIQHSDLNNTGNVNEENEEIFMGGQYIVDEFLTSLAIYDNVSQATFTMNDTTYTVNVNKIDHGDSLIQYTFGDEYCDSYPFYFFIEYGYLGSGTYGTLAAYFYTTLTDEIISLNGVEIVEHDFKKIDANYLPDTYASETYVDAQISSHTHSWDELINKPFYNETIEYIIVEDNTYDDREEYYCYEYELAQNVIVEYDGEEYFVERYSEYDGAASGCMYVGNGSLYRERFENNGLPFVVVGNCYDSGDTAETMIIFEDGESHNLKVYWSEEKFKQLDEQFIPDTIARTTYVDEQLSTKSDSNHSHNELYYTETEVNNLLNEKANTSALDNYYTKSEVEQFHDEIKDYVDDEVAALVNSAPETLDTLGELAEAFQEHEEVVDVLNAAIATKYSSTNPPPYPVTSVQGKTGAITFTTETWTFTLSDGSTVTKKVLLG